MMLQARGMHLPQASTIATSLPYHRRAADLPSLVSQDQHDPTSPPRPRTPFPSTGAVFLLAGTKGKGRKPKGKPFLTLKTPEDTELNCHHSKPTGRQQTPNRPLRTTAGLVRGWANMPTQHETPPRRSSPQVWLTLCQKPGQALLYTKLNQISFLVC